MISQLEPQTIIPVYWSASRRRNNKVRYRKDNINYEAQIPDLYPETLVFLPEDYHKMRQYLTGPVTEVEVEWKQL